MSWFSRIFSPITKTRDAQTARGTRVVSETFQLRPTNPSLEVGIPLDWSRTPWQDCIRFAPPELAMINRKYSAKIDIQILETGEPLPDGRFLPQGRVDDMQFAYQHLYESFQCLDFQKVAINGADDAAYIRFRYSSYGVPDFTFERTHLFILK